MNEVNIFSEECNNLPGVKRLLYVHKTSVEAMSYPSHSNQWRIHNLELVTNKKAGQIFFIPELTQFDEALSESEHGDLYNLSVKGKLLSTHELKTSTLMALTIKESIFFIEDMKNNFRVIGNQDKGAMLKLSLSSNIITAGIFGYDLSINYLTDCPAYWLEKNFDITENSI